MRVLIIGAGVLESNLAHSIQKENDVTLLAINETYKDLKENGLIIKHKLGKKTIDHFNIINKLEFEILPKGEYEICVNKKNLCAAIYRFMFSNFIGKVCISDHAMSAKEEFLILESEFEKLKNKTKVYDKLKLELLNYKD